MEGVLPSASVLTFTCALEPARGFCSALQSEAIAGQQSQTPGLSAVPHVCEGSVDLPVHPVSWRPEVGPPPSSSRVTSNLGVGAPPFDLDDIIWLSGAFTQCSSKGHSRYLVCLPWL